MGKSSLLNRLCGAEVPAQDMLFATLDPTARRLTLPSGLTAVMVDTVGFVSRLPHGLVEAFKSTLEEAAYADVIVKVCDLSDPESAQQLTVTDQDVYKRQVEHRCHDIRVPGGIGVLRMLRVHVAEFEAMNGHHQPAQSHQRRERKSQEL